MEYKYDQKAMESLRGFKNRSCEKYKCSCTNTSYNVQISHIEN